MNNANDVVLDRRPIKISNVLTVAHGRGSLLLDTSADFVKRIQAGREALEALWRSSSVVYGVTTGVGDSCERMVPVELSDRLAVNILRMHGCGLGEFLDETTCRAVMVVRLASLRSGYSAVRYELLERMALLLKEGVAPRIPAEGSVGASGDLTPLSYLAAMLIGEREVYYNGEVRLSEDVHQELSLDPFRLKAKEALAIMNGTSVMTAIACFAWQRAQALVHLGASLTAVLVEVLQVNKGHFDPRIFACKPHPGQSAVAAQICEEIAYDDNYRHADGERIQATYSIRCAPHILGVLADCLPWMRQQIETEINSVNDNPLIDPDTGDVLHGGNFYGGHIAFAMDSLKNAVANCADLFDRQMALLVNEKSNNGLSSNLSGVTGEMAAINHGFKAVHITTSACAAEALKGSMPASVFSRSTESHNQDKVSMGTIAARDCIRVLELTEQNLAATLMAGVQGLDLRVKNGELQMADLHPKVRELYDRVRGVSAFLHEDRALDGELRELTSLIRTEELVDIAKSLARKGEDRR